MCFVIFLWVKMKCFLNNIPKSIDFANYKDFLLYMFNSVHSTGNLNDVIFKVKHQHKAKPFDYNYNIQEGNN